MGKLDKSSEAAEYKWKNQNSGFPYCCSVDGWWMTLKITTGKNFIKF